MTKRIWTEQDRENDRKRYVNRTPEQIACKKCDDAKYRLKHDTKAYHKKWYEKNKEHNNKKSQEWYRNNKAKVIEQTWVRSIREKFGITPEQYYELVEQQGNKCAICGSSNPQVRGKGKWHIDHCHKTNKVRGLLCFKCNTGLGLFNDNPELFKIATAYLLTFR